MQSPPFHRYLVPPRSKYSPQHHILKHPQLPFFPQCQRPSFTPIRTHKSPPPVSILGHPSPVPIPKYHLLEIHPYIFHPSTPRSPQLSLSLRFSIHPFSSSMPHAQPISFFLILSLTQYWVRRINHLAHRYAISSIPPLPRPS